jgi:hypothetical protein
MVPSALGATSWFTKLNCVSIFAAVYVLRDGAGLSGITFTCALVSTAGRDRVPPWRQSSIRRT